MNRWKLEYLRYLRDMGESFLLLPEKHPTNVALYTENVRGGQKRSDIVQNAPYELSNKPEMLSVAQKEQLLNDFHSQIKDCTKCPLHSSRTRFVFGCGSADADIIFIGEAPGAEEDRQGIPFVGRAGKLLDRILAAAGLKRSDVYIANVLKCRPPQNRDPLPAEEQVCLPYLYRQIEIIQPKVICCLGRVSAQALLKTRQKMSELRGIVHEFRGIPMVVTYHPAALLRNDRLKRPTWEDFQFMLELIKERKN